MLLSIFQFTRDFNREYKYTVGESLKKETIELLTLIYRANSKYRKTEILQTARERIEVIRLLIRLMKDMKQISLGKFVKINVVVENVSKQLTKRLNLQYPWFHEPDSSALICLSL